MVYNTYIIYVVHMLKYVFMINHRCNHIHMPPQCVFTYIYKYMHSHAYIATHTYINTYIHLHI